MKLLLGFSLSALVFAQSASQQVMVAQKIAAGGSSVSVGIHISSSGGCTNGDASCTYSGALDGSTAGSTVTVAFAYCPNSGCSTTDCPAITVTDTQGGNTWVDITAATASITNTAYQHVFYAKNITGGNGAITVACSGGVFHYFNYILIEALGANATTPIDGNISTNTVTGNPTYSLSSPSTTAASGELALAFVNCGTPTFDAPWTSVEGVMGGYKSAKSSPSSGATVTVSGGCSSGPMISLIAVKP